MSIASTDLKKYGSVSRPEDDTSTSGGAIDAACLLDVTQLAATDTLVAVSDNAADTMNLTLRGRNAAGSIVSETLALTGTTPVSFTTTFERFISAQLATAAAGSIAITRATGGANVATLPPARTDAAILFIASSSEAGQTIRYEKEFWKNEHGTLTLNDAVVELTADPSASIRIGLAAAKGDTGSVANRKTAPGGVTFVDDSVQQSVPGTTLAAAETIGVWIEMTRAADAAAIKSSYTTQLSGTSI